MIKVFKVCAINNEEARESLVLHNVKFDYQNFRRPLFFKTDTKRQKLLYNSHNLGENPKGSNKPNNDNVIKSKYETITDTNYCYDLLASTFKLDQTIRSKCDHADFLWVYLTHKFLIAAETDKP